jgi:hypothetical protein
MICIALQSSLTIWWTTSSRLDNFIYVIIVVEKPSILEAQARGTPLPFTIASVVRKIRGGKRQ